MVLRYSDILKFVYSAITVLTFSSCVQSYMPPASTTPYNYLVVDGFINAGNDSTYFKLSRTGPLSGNAQILPETHASVVIEGNNNSSFTLYETSPGSYSCGPFNPSNNVQYRLHVTTSNRSQYESDYITPMYAPPIDSISWANTSTDEAGESGVTIYVNAHNNNNASRYYRWVYYETWEFHPAFKSVWGNEFFLNKLGVPSSDSKAIYSCWHTDTSTNILLGSTVNLSENVISQIPIEFIPDSSWKISVEYSIFLQQQVLDKNAYAFFQVLQQNTEELGAIFSPQPATGINTNIHCLNNPSETVIGYIYSTSTTSQRIFIKNNQVPDWYQGPNSCVEWPPAAIDDSAMDIGLIIGADYYRITIPICADCLLSGTNIEPTFWPN